MKAPRRIPPPVVKPDKDKICNRTPLIELKLFCTSETKVLTATIVEAELIKPIPREANTRLGNESEREPNILKIDAPLATSISSIQYIKGRNSKQANYERIY